MTAKPKLIFEIDQRVPGTIAFDIREATIVSTSNTVEDDPTGNARMAALRARGIKHCYCATYQARALNIRMRWEKFNGEWMEPRITHDDRVECFLGIAKFLARVSRTITKHTGRCGWLSRDASLSGFHLKPEVVLGALMKMGGTHVRYETLPEVGEYAGETVAA